MPVKVAVHNKQRLFLTYFQGPVPVQEVPQAIDDLERGVTGAGVYRGLVIFERDVILSQWDGVALRDMLRRAARAYYDLGLQRAESAAVVLAREAHDVVRLWNALNAFSWDIEMAFNIFWDVGPALRFLAVSPNVLAPVLGPETSAFLREWGCPPPPQRRGSGSSNGS